MEENEIIEEQKHSLDFIAREFSRLKAWTH